MDIKALAVQHAEMTPRSAVSSVMCGLLVLTLSTSVCAQGSIFGTVVNSNLTTPANHEIRLIGYINNSDAEIRIIGSDGAGYDDGNWFDDFQNYQTEAPGNPYAYHLYNTVNNEGFRLSGVIPNNSFQQEDVTLAAVDWPESAKNLNAHIGDDGYVWLIWQPADGVSWHIYRRAFPSTGSFFRIDNPGGDLADPGVPDSYFMDTDVETGEIFDYVIIAESSQGDFSPPSDIVTIDITACCQGMVGNVNGLGGDTPTMGDVSLLIDHLFISGAPLNCYAEADINQSGGPNPTADDLSIGDISILIDYLFITGPSLGLPSCIF